MHIVLIMFTKINSNSHVFRLSIIIITTLSIYLTILSIDLTTKANFSVFPPTATSLFDLL